MSTESRPTSVPVRGYSPWFVLITVVFVTCLITANVTVVKARLARRQATQKEGAKAGKPPWAEAFQDNVVAFVDQLIDENRALFGGLARL